MATSANKIIIYSDGGSRGNPGPAAVGAVIKFKGKTWKISKSIGKATNNIAEYRAVIEALKKARQALGKKKIKECRAECFLDSELIVKQLNREYKIKDPILGGYFIELWNLTFDFSSVTFSHIKRESNKKADELVNQALDRKD